MEKILKGLVGKKVEINGGTNVFYCGELVSVGDGVAHLRDDEGQMVYFAIVAIAALSERSEPVQRPGFIA